MHKEDALAGTRVVEFAWAIVGPWVGSYLGAFGADVVKVESATAPDMSRLSAPYVEDIAGLNRSGLFNVSNNNKYSIALDMNTPEGVLVAKRLVAWADVVVETFPPSVMEKWGLGHEQLTRINPGVVVFSSSLLGHNGPYAELRGLGHNSVSMAGYTHLTGWPDRNGVGPAVAYTDWVAPPFAVAAIMAALANRRKTGRGEIIEISQYEIGVAFISQVLLDFFANGREETRDGNRSPEAAPHGVYRCSGDDRWCAISVRNEQEWTALCRAMSDPEWAKSKKFNTMAGRKAGETELDGLVEEWTSRRSPESVRETLQSFGVPAGVVQSTEEVIENDDQLKEREAFWRTNHPEVGKYRYLRPVPKLSGNAARPHRPTPCLGEHTEHVCREFLKMPDEEFVDLLNKGVFK